MTKLLMVFACFTGLTGVVLGAFGAHALKNRLSPDSLHTWETAVEYQLFHSLALLISCVLALQWGDSGWLRWSGGAFALGMLLFSGSLYILSLTTGMRWLGPVTPIGGLALIVGWILLLASVVRQPL